MFRISNKIYIKSLTLFILAFLFISSIFIYLFIMNYKSNRVYNLRAIPKEYRVTLFTDYIDNVYTDNSILFIGDSQTNGHRFPENKIFTTLLQKKLKIHTLNFAFPDERILDNIYILNYLKKNHMTFNTIVFNANQSHVKVNNSQHLEIENPKNYIIGIMKELKSFIKFIAKPNPTTIPNEKIHLSKYENYFDMNTSSIKSYEIKLLDLIKVAKSISSNVIIYITPHSHNAVLHNNKNDIKTLNFFSQEVFRICAQNHIQCLEPDIKEDKYYIDIVHFNSEGHKKMANILYKFITTKF